MKILLVNPPYDIRRYMGKLANVGIVFPPIGLLYIASYLRKRRPDIQVDVFDFQVEEREFFTLLAEFDPEIIGITCQSALVYATLDLAAKVKNANSRTTVVVGGVHANIRPQDLLASPHVDFVVRGEGEETFTELCQALEAQTDTTQIPGIAFSTPGHGITKTPKRPLIKDLDSLPFPAIDLVPLSKYSFSPDMQRGKMLGFILTSRGCPHNCFFCANQVLTGRTHRQRSAANVIEEFETYLRKYPIDQFKILDDNFFLNRKRTHQICERLIPLKDTYGFNWTAQGRVDMLNDELLQVMKRSGCSILSFGLESGNQRLLDLIGKNLKLETVREKMKLVRKSGIDSRASFILGLPGETEEESRRTIRFAYSLPLDQVRFSLATPFPGTKLWDIAVDEGRIRPDEVDWTKLSLMSGYTDYEPVYYPKGRDPVKLKRLQRQANLLFFLRFRIVLGFLRRIRSPRDLFSLLRGFRYLMSSSLSEMGISKTRQK